MFRRDAVAGGKGVVPEHGILDQVDQNQPGYVTERKHTIGAAGAIFDGTDVSFDIGYVLGSCAGVEDGEPLSKGFEFVVAEDARVGFDAAIPFAHNVAHTVHREGGHLQNMADGTDIMSMQSARGVLTATAAPTHICSRFPFKQVPARGVSHLEEVWVQFYRLVNKVFARGNGWKLFPVQQLLARPGLV